MSTDEENTLEIILDDGEQDLVEFLCKGRFDRARERKAEWRKMGKEPDKYTHDRVGLLAELSFAKFTDVYPSQVLSPKINTKISGRDMGDTIYKGLRFDVKATIHENGVLWIDKINENIDYYVFFVVTNHPDKAVCKLKGVIKASVLHSIEPRNRRQFKFPCIFVEQQELTPWGKFEEERT